MLVTVSAFIVAAAMPALVRAPRHPKRLARPRPFVDRPSLSRVVIPYGRCGSRIGRKATSNPCGGDFAARDVDRRRRRLRRRRRPLLLPPAGLVRHTRRSTGGRRGASSAPGDPRQSRRHGPRRSVDRRPKGSLSRRGRTPASGRQHGRRMRRRERRSRATKSWCLALVGYTAQQFGNYPRADAAFTSALAEMPESERWKWEDLALLLGGRAAGPYRRVDGEPRDSMTAAFWRLVQPLYLTSVNDLRTEFLARITRMYIEQDSRTTMSDWWRSDDRETLLRYGVALWYTQGEVPRGSMGPPEIAGIRRVPSFNFFPDAHVFESPDQLTPTDWEFQKRGKQADLRADLGRAAFNRSSINQVALFRRGDSAFIVAAFAVNDDAALGLTRRAGTFAAVVDRGGVLPPFGTTIENAGLSVVSTLVAPWRPMIISLEVLDSVKRAAGRMRFAPKLPLLGHATESFGPFAVCAARFRAEIAHRGRAAHVACVAGAEQPADRHLLGDVWRASPGRNVRLRARGGAYRPRVHPRRPGQTARQRSGPRAQLAVARSAVGHGPDRVARRDGGSLAPQTRAVSRAADADVRGRSPDRRRAEY